MTCLVGAQEGCAQFRIFACSSSLNMPMSRGHLICPCLWVKKRTKQTEVTSVILRDPDPGPLPNIIWRMGHQDLTVPAKDSVLKIQSYALWWSFVGVDCRDHSVQRELTPNPQGFPCAERAGVGGIDWSCSLEWPTVFSDLVLEPGYSWAAWIAEELI